MITIAIKSVSFRKKIAENIIEFLKMFLVIKPMQFLHNPVYYAEKLELLRKMPSNTVGSDLAKMLDRGHLKLIPRFEEHDLKHLILDYGMTSEEEIRMQAFLLGNGNYSIFCILFLISGILLPSSWNIFYQDYKLGQCSPSILNLSISECMWEKTEMVKTQ